MIDTDEPDNLGNGLAAELAEAEAVKLTIAHLVGAGLDISEPTAETICPFCQQPRDDVRKRRRNTASANDGSNWIVCCGECFQDDVAHFKEMWDAYYADCL
jgi:hypothetical protein